jgi:hypothetical protein
MAAASYGDREVAQVLIGGRRRPARHRLGHQRCRSWRNDIAAPVGTWHVHCRRSPHGGWRDRDCPSRVRRRYQRHIDPRHARAGSHRRAAHGGRAWTVGRDRPAAGCLDARGRSRPRWVYRAARGGVLRPRRQRPTSPRPRCRPQPPRHSVRQHSFGLVPPPAQRSRPRTRFMVTSSRSCDPSPQTSHNLNRRCPESRSAVRPAPRSRGVRTRDGRRPCRCSRARSAIGRWLDHALQRADAAGPPFRPPL